MLFLRREPIAFVKNHRLLTFSRLLPLLLPGIRRDEDEIGPPTRLDNLLSWLARLFQLPVAPRKGIQRIHNRILEEDVTHFQHIPGTSLTGNLVHTYDTASEVTHGIVGNDRTEDRREYVSPTGPEKVTGTVKEQ